MNRGAHCYCNEGEDSKLMANFIPCKNQERNINSIKVNDTGISKPRVLTLNADKTCANPVCPT